MSVVEFNVSPKYKKSFIEYNYLEKNINGKKKIKLVKELVWRSGEINVIVNNDEFIKFKNAEELFNSIKKHEVLLFDDEFPFEYEFVSSWDGCYDDYSITYEDGSDVEKELEEEIMNVIEEEGIHELEDNHDFIMMDTTYEMDGALEIQKLN